MSKIVISELDFHYIEYYNPVFEQVNLSLDTDWRLGLIGRNGRGKTTFLKLLKGELEPDRGTIVKQVDMEYFPYEYQTDYVLTLDVMKEIIGQLKSMEDSMERLLLDPTSENLEQYGEIQGCYEDSGGYEMEGRIRKELYIMGLPEDILDRDFDVLSGGEKTKMYMIALFLRKNAFILMDEPTNHLDIRGKEAVANYLKQKQGFMVASHDRQFLDEVTDHILAINKTNIVLEKGNYTSWKENVSKTEVYEFRTKIRLEKEISVLERGAVIRRGWAAIAEKEKNPYKTNNRGNSSRAAKFMHQAKRAEAGAQLDIAQKKELLKNYETVPDLYFFMPEQLEQPKKQELADEQRLLAWLDKVTFGYEGHMLLHEFSMTISEGERIWIKGGNGCGKSTLLRILSGELVTPYRKVQEDVVFSVSYQEPLWQAGYVSEKITGGERLKRFLEICECLDVSAELLQRPIQTYSSGEKSKIDVARALSEAGQILLLDEPLNFMDVYFREQLEKAILAFRPTLVFVEHDERFGSHVATRTINLDRLSGCV